MSNPIFAIKAGPTGCVPNNCQLLDPTLVVSSRWSNRAPESFSGPPYESLKRDIEECGGNVQPIKVRRTADRYEIVFGHRRHRACLEIGVPVLALIADVDDRTMWQEMERENRHRADLSPYEQGLHYKLALDRCLFPSIRSLAAAIGVDASQAAKVIKIAELPEEVLAAFGSPHVVQVNWANALHRVLARDRDGAIRRSKDIASGSPNKPSASSTFAAITRDASVEPFHAPTVEIRDSAGQRVAWIRQAKGNYQIELRAQGIALDSLEEAVKRLIPV